MVVVGSPAITVSVICGRIVGETTTIISITTVLGLKVLGFRVLVIMEKVRGTSTGTRYQVRGTVGF